MGETSSAGGSPVSGAVRKAVLFDMGNVLIGWEVRPPFRPHFDSEAALDDFLRGPFREIYDAVHDGDGSMKSCLEPMRERYPEAAQLIDIYETSWGSFITGIMQETVAVVRELDARGVKLYGLTNWPAQVWPPQTALPPSDAKSYAFLDLFLDVYVSGEHKLRKPNPAIYTAALERFGLRPEEAAFVDDLEPNVAAADALGLLGIHFRDAKGLRCDLESNGLL